MDMILSKLNSLHALRFSTIAQKFQADLPEVGMWLEGYRNGQEPFTLSLWGPDFRDPGNYLEFLPEKKVGLRANWKNANSSADIQELRDKALVETNPEERTNLFAAIQDYLQQNGPFAPLVQNSIQIGLNSALKGFVYNPQWRVDVALLSK
jgi:peptide/nickel transport system substrate-binding protein